MDSDDDDNKEFIGKRIDFSSTDFGKSTGKEIPNLFNNSNIK